MEEIMLKLHQLRDQKQRAIIVTIIDVDGSAYRREGARCLITEQGDMIGFISGGCVEGDLKEHAKEVFDTGLPKKLTYDFRWESDDIWGLGVGCNGSITVWLELFDPIHKIEEAGSILSDLANRQTCETPYLIGTVIQTSNEQEIPVGLREIVEPSQLTQLLRKEAGLVQCNFRNVEVTLFVERVQPRPRLSIIGSGPDAALLCQAASALGWRIAIIDHREGYANTRFFPKADEIILIPRADFSKLTTTASDYFVVMTHNLDIDVEAIKFLLPREIAYIGLLGSRQRNDMILKQIQFTDRDVKEEWFRKIYAPIGLDIGAKSPNEIILSIMAELVAHRNHKSGGFLRDLRELSNA